MDEREEGNLRKRGREGKEMKEKELQAATLERGTQL